MFVKCGKLPGPSDFCVAVKPEQYVICDRGTKYTFSLGNETLRRPLRIAKSGVKPGTVLYCYDAEYQDCLLCDLIL